MSSFIIDVANVDFPKYQNTKIESIVSATKLVEKWLITVAIN